LNLFLCSCWKIETLNRNSEKPSVFSYCIAQKSFISSSSWTREVLTNSWKPSMILNFENLWVTNPA
jgi:hypothetical protein